MLDVSRLVPEARSAAATAAAIYVRHTAPWMVGLLAHGSAVKGGWIPGCSDIDFQLFLEPAAFQPDGTLPLDLCLAIQRDLAPTIPTPFRAIQAYAYPCALPAGQVGPVPGAYAVVAGRVPVPEASAAQLRAAAQAALAALTPVPPKLSAALLDAGDGRLARWTRLVCTDVWPALYQLLTIREPDPIAVWNLPKPAAIALLPTQEPVGQAIRAFDAAVRAHYPTEATSQGALDVIRRAAAFLGAVVAWYVACGRG